MPSLKAIRKRITTVRNTQKITRAMKLVAAAKLRRAQDGIIAARPYARALERLVAELADDARGEHPLFADRKSDKASIVMLTSDRGLAGAFNASIVRRVESFVDESLADHSDVSLRAVGRKGNDYFKRRKANIASYDPAPTSATALQTSQEIANRIIDDFLEERVDRVYLVFNEFKSAISQGVVVKQILPIESVAQIREEHGDDDEAHEDEELAHGGDMVYEPNKGDLLNHLAPLYVQIGIYIASLESVASELGARMTAMDNATRNAGEMISSLTLKYNRARQAAITTELMEIIGGAEALKG